MAQRRHTKILEAFGSGTAASTNTWKVRLIPSASPTSNIIKAITACTNAASPQTVTVGSTTGWANGNIVVVWGLTGNTSANGTWVVANLTGTTFDLQTVPGPGQTALVSTGNGTAVVTSAFVINLSLASASTDLPTAAGGSTDQTLASVTVTNGVFTCTTPINWSSNVAQSTGIKALEFYQSTGTDRLALWADGYIQTRVVTQAAASATAIAVEPLFAPIPNGTAIAFSNGVTGTLTAQASAGATALAVSALAALIPIGHTGDAPILNANLPATTGSPGAQTFQFNVDPTNGLFPI